MQNNPSEPHRTSMGLRQEDVVLYISVNIPLIEVVRDSGMETKGTIYNKSIHILAHADDIVLVERTTGMLKEAIINLSNAAKTMRLTINLQKN
jgi:hypothetical protein